MFNYPITLKESMRCTMAQVPAAQVKFDNPALTQFFKDKDSNLCSISIKRFINGVEGVHQHELTISYTDKELEVLRRLEY